MRQPPTDDSRTGEIMARLRARHGMDKPLLVAPPQRKRGLPSISRPPPKALPVCACGCKGRPLHGKWLPGHNAKPRSPRKDHPPCECGCKGMPAGANSRFLPGHDAKWASQRRRIEKGERNAKGFA